MEVAETLSAKLAGRFRVHLYWAPVGLLRVGVRAPGYFQHIGDGGDAADGVFAKGPAVGNRADQAAVYINRTAAHTRDHACVLQRTTGETGQDPVHMRFAHRFHHAEDLDLKGVDLGSLKGRQPITAHTATQVVGFHDGDGLRAKRRSE